MKSIKFYREKCGRWYADIPEWTGSKDDLEMVMGADTMLEYMSEGEAELFLTISEEEFDSHKYVLEFKEEMYDGASYLFKGNFVEYDVWLCSVTKFVFGKYPSKLYLL